MNEYSKYILSGLFYLILFNVANAMKGIDFVIILGLTLIVTNQINQNKDE